MSGPDNNPSLQDKTKLKRLRLKIRHLAEELDQASDLSKSYEAQFQNVISDFQVLLGLKKPDEKKEETPSAPASNSSNPQDLNQPRPGMQPDPEAVKNDNEDIRHEVDNHSANAPSWMKKLYKQIAMKTHPDRVSHQDLSPYELAEYQRLFEIAKQAVQDSNGGDLVYAAEVLDIEPDIPPTMRISLLVARGEKLKTQIQKIYKSPSWLWCESHNSLGVRKKILLSFCQIYKLNIPDPKVLDEFLNGLKE